MKLLKPRTILLLSLLGSYMSSLAQQTGGIKGRITTSDGKPAAYVSVALKEIGAGNNANKNGEYKIEHVKAGSYTLKVSAIGLLTQEKQVTIQAGQTSSLDLVLKESAQQLHEVTVKSVKNNKFKTKQSDQVSKMSLNNLENPQVYSSIPKELLKEQLIFSVDDAVKNSPGIQTMWQANGRAGDGGAYYNLRGFVLQSKLRNGIAGNVSSKIDVSNLERIEVIKGPSATLFGNALSTYGGLINRVTKKPYDTFGGEIELSGGSYDFHRASVDINTPINKNVSLRINTAYNYQGSFQDQGFSRDFIFSPSLTYRVNDRLSFNFEAELYRGRNTGGQTYFFVYGKPISLLGVDRADQLKMDYKKSYINNNLSQESRNSNYFAQMNYKLASNWTSQTNLTMTNSFSNGPNPYFYLLSNGDVTGNKTEVGNDFISRNDQATDNGRDRTTEIQQNFTGDFKIAGMRNRIVVGLDFFRQNSDILYVDNGSFDTVRTNGNIPNYSNFNKATLDAKNAAGPVQASPSIFKSNTYSAYISDVWNVTDQLIALAALRIDLYRNKGYYDRSGNQTDAPYQQNALSPKFGLVYQVIKDQVALFANYQNGFTNKAGIDYYTRKALRPEKANQIEGGVKLDAFDGKLSTTLTYYNIEVKDVARPSDVPAIYFQDGTQLSRGFEAEVIANPITGLNIVAGFSYNDSKFDKNAAADVAGRRPATASSPYLANLWISYRLPAHIVKGLGFGFGGNYASDNMVVNTVKAGTFTLPAYTIFNASASYEYQKFRFGVKMGNIGNQKYWTGYTTVNPQMLRNVAGSIAYKF